MTTKDTLRTRAEHLTPAPYIVICMYLYVSVCICLYLHTPLNVVRTCDGVLSLFFPFLLKKNSNSSNAAATAHHSQMLGELVAYYVTSSYILCHIINGSSQPNVGCVTAWHLCERAMSSRTHACVAPNNQNVGRFSSSHVCDSCNMSERG